MSDSPDKQPLDPKTDDPGQNSQIHNSTRKQGEVSPSDYPAKDRHEGSVTRDPDAA